MARVRMVTRTVEVTVASIMCLNMDTMVGELHDFELTGNVTDNNDILKKVGKTYDIEMVKPVAVMNVEHKEVLYGMTELEFVKLAKVLPPRNGNNSEDELE